MLAVGTGSIPDLAVIIKRKVDACDVTPCPCKCLLPCCIFQYKWGIGACPGFYRNIAIFFALKLCLCCSNHRRVYCCNVITIHIGYGRVSKYNIGTKTLRYKLHRIASGPYCIGILYLSVIGYLINKCVLSALCSKICKCYLHTSGRGHTLSVKDKGKIIGFYGVYELCVLLADCLINDLCLYLVRYSYLLYM